MAFLFGDEEPYHPNLFQETALYLGMIEMPISAIVFGLLALRQIKGNPSSKGKGLAYIALILASLWILLCGIDALASYLGP